MDNFRLRPLSESDIDQIIEEAGGERVHPNADQRDKIGSDYLIDSCAIELKSLDDEGLTKPERQAKLASLFRPLYPTRPVIVLDRASITTAKQRDFDRILEGPIKTGISKAKKQLKQTRTEHKYTTTSIIWFVNNGYTALDHDSLLKLIVHRIRNDTNEIDGVIVSVCYFHSDTIDSFFLWPFEYIPINLDKTFPSHDRLQQAWHALAMQQMTKVVQQAPSKQDIKGPVLDTQFDIDGITYVKPAPPIGEPSEFFLHGRPRLNSTGITTSPQVGLIFGDLSLNEWTKFKNRLPGSLWLGATYEEWKTQKSEAATHATSRKVFIPIAITLDAWSSWADQVGNHHLTSHRYATQLFERKIASLINDSKDIDTEIVLPHRYMLIVTEEIGQDKKNDVSHAVIVTEYIDGTRDFDGVFDNQRLFHEYAVTLGCAHAIARDVQVVRWRKDRTYAWR